jgi:hypothetical protein
MIGGDGEYPEIFQSELLLMLSRGMRGKPLFGFGDKRVLLHGGEVLGCRRRYRLGDGVEDAALRDAAEDAVKLRFRGCEDGDRIGAKWPSPDIGHNIRDEATHEKRCGTGSVVEG